MNFCSEADCAMPRWRDGIEPTKCVGHQVVNPPDFIEHPTTGRVIEIEDVELVCWECGARPPASLAFVDTEMMAGEVWCASCIASNGVSGKVLVHKIRIDDSGDNF